MDKALEVKKLKKSYGNFALRDVSFKVPRGYITGFIGPNGSGKTTTLKSILGLLSDVSGSIRLFDQETAGRSTELNRRIGVVMDAAFYVDEWTPRDIELALVPHYLGWKADRYRQLLERFAIDPAARIKSLSRGTRVKLMTAVALAHEADLLMLDEPTSGLDPVARDELAGLLGDFVSDESKSVLFSTHITQDLEKIADYIVYIQEGAILYEGPKEDLLESYVIVRGEEERLTEAQRRSIRGLRRHGSGFEGMVESSLLKALPAGLLVEPATLDEIIVFMNNRRKEA